MSEDIDHFLGHVDVVSGHVGSPTGHEVGEPAFTLDQIFLVFPETIF
jgi:hypothetical protein